jgi:hypothetical protein
MPHRWTAGSVEVPISKTRDQDCPWASHDCNWENTKIPGGSAQGNRLNLIQNKPDEAWPAHLKTEGPNNEHAVDTRRGTEVQEGQYIQPY